MINLIHKSTLNYFGLDRMGFHWSQTCEEFKQDIIDAIVNDQILVLPGEVGAGKTTLFDKAAEHVAAMTKFIYVRNMYKEHLTISGIINAVIYDLSDEPVKRDLEARSRQFIRIVGETKLKSEFSISIVIEEAHRLHTNTLRALKELREARYAGRSPLFSIILIGHPELMEKVQKRREVLWRCQSIELNEEGGWMQFDERVIYLRNVFKGAITNEARKSIALICKEPLEMVKYVYLKMREAKKAGYKIIDSDVVQPSARELMEAYKISLGDITKVSGIPKSTINDAVKLQKHQSKEAVELAIKKIVKQRAGELTAKAS